MRTFALTAFVLSLAACQSCRNTRAPAPPVPEIVQDSGMLADAAGTTPVVLADASLPEVPASDAGAAKDPLEPCLSLTLGVAHDFCKDPGLTVASVVPESPVAKVKLASLQSQTTVRTRLVVRHSNGSKTAKMKVVVVLTNGGPAAGSFVLLKKGVAGPTTDLVEGETLAAGRWATSGPKTSVSVAPGKSVRFDASVEVGLPYSFATMGLYEYSFSQPHTVSVCLLGEREDWSVCPSL